MFSQPLASGSKPSEMSNSELMRPSTVRLAGRRRIDAGQQLEQRALAGAVVADDADALALVDPQADVAQRLDLHDRVDGAAKQLPDEEFLERDPSLRTHAEREADVVEFDVGHDELSTPGNAVREAPPRGSGRGCCR